MIRKPDKVSDPLHYIVHIHYGPAFNSRKEAFDQTILTQIFIYLKSFFKENFEGFLSIHEPNTKYIKDVKKLLRDQLPLCTLTSNAKVIQLITPWIYKVLVENCADARKIPDFKERDIFPLLLLYLTHEGNPVFSSTRLKSKNLHRLYSLEEILLELRSFHAPEVVVEASQVKRHSEPTLQIDPLGLKKLASSLTNIVSLNTGFTSNSDIENAFETDPQIPLNPADSETDTTIEVETNDTIDIESLFEGLEGASAGTRNFETTNLGEELLPEIAGENKSLVGYPNSTPATTPSEQSPDQDELEIKIEERDSNFAAGHRETDDMAPIDLKDIKLFGEVVDDTTPNFTTSNWEAESKFESIENCTPIRIGAPNARIKTSWATREFPTAQLVAVTSELHRVKGHVNIMLSDINTAMIICEKHQVSQNRLPKVRLSDEERGNPNSANVKNIKNYKNDYARLVRLRNEINSEISALSHWITFDSRPPLDAWFNTYMGIIKTTCDKMVKELQDIDESLPRTNSGELIDGVSSMMATLDLQDRSHKGVEYKLGSNGKGMFSVKLPVFRGNPLEYKKWKKELDDLFLNAYKRGASNFSAPIVWGLIFESLDKDLFYQWKDVYDKTDEGIDKLLQKLEKRYNDVYQLGLLYKGELQNVPSPKDDDLASLEQLIHRLARIEKGLIDAGTHIKNNSQELLLHLMPKISKKAPKLYADWLSRQQIVVHQKEEDGSLKSNDGLRLKDEYKEFKRFLDDRATKLSALDLQKRLYSFDGSNAYGHKRNNGRNFTGQVHSSEETGEHLKRKREYDPRDQSWAGNVANKRRKRLSRSDNPRDRLGRKEKPKFKRDIGRRSAYNTDARNIINRVQTKGKFIKTCPFHKNQNQSGHSPVECQNLNDNAFRDKKQLVWAILHRNKFCVGCLKKHEGKCRTPQKCDIFDNGKNCPHVHHRKLHFAQENYLNKKRYLDKAAYYDAQIDNYFKK